MAYCALSALLRWQLLAEFGSHIPLGELGEPTVPFFNLWTLLWNADRLQHGFARYWDAPIFFPARDALAMSEPQGLTGLLFAPLSAALGAVAAYNLTLLLLLAANGLAGRRLLLETGVAPALATWGGMLFVGLQFLREELGVLQLCATWPIVLGLSEIARLTREPDPWAVVRLGLWLVACGWSCLYYLLFFGVLCALAGPFLISRAFFERRMLLATLLSLSIVVVGLWPLTAAEERAVAAYTRGADAIHTGSGSALAYVQFPHDTPLARLFPGWSRTPSRRSLYPGALLLSLALIGGITHGRRERPRLLVYSCTALLIALLLSFGTRLHFAGITPYALTAQRFLPGFDHLRSPYRGAAIVQLIVALWAGNGLAVVTRRLQPAAARFAPFVLVLWALLEITPWHLARAPFPFAALEEPWITWLAQQPEGAVAMLPANPTGHVRDYFDTSVYMLQGLRHGHPIVNGYSGFFPPAADRMVDALRTFPSERCVQALHKSHVRYAVVDRKLDAVRELSEHPNAGLTPVFTSGPRLVYLVE